jgi:uncharacterized protein
MKFVLLIVAVLALLWLLRRSIGGVSRTPPPGSAPTGQSAARTAPPMLTCAHCGTHLPRELALPGRGGVFCDAAHRAAFEAAHPEP